MKHTHTHTHTHARTHARTHKEGICKVLGGSVVFQHFMQIFSLPTISDYHHLKEMPFTMEGE